MNWYFQVLKKYAVFGGRARRKEYWIFNLVQAIAVFGLKGLALLVPNYGDQITLVLMAYLFVTFVPLIAVTVRRLHDINHSGWWFLIALLPIANLVLFFGFLTKDSQPGENRFGPNPKAELGGTALVA